MPDTTTIPIRILVLDDNPMDAQLSVSRLKNSGLEIAVDIANCSSQFKERVLTQAYDVILGDYRLPDWTGLDAMRWLRESGYYMPFILVTGTLGDELAVECIREGATDYVLKDKPERLIHVVQRALREKALRAERDHAEFQLRQSEADYRSIIQGAPYGIFRADRAGRILMTNPAMVAMLNYASEGELMGTNMGRDIWCDPRQRESTLAAVGTSNSYSHQEVQWKRKDGKLITVRLAGRRLPAKNGGEFVFEVFVENLTDQLALARQFLQAQKMEAIGRLAGGVAHDFNNLLMVIRGCTELLEHHKHHPDKLSGYLRQIDGATTSATSVVQQLLAFSRKEAPEQRILELNSVLKDLLRMLPRLLGEDIEVVIHQGLEHLFMRADIGHLEQIIMNLAINARDAMPHGGILAIETGAVHVERRLDERQEGASSAGRFVVLSMSDTGIGMDKDTLSHLFEPFFTTKERGKGTGLGLSTVYGIVKQNGGFISVESISGQGSTFKVHFPATEAVTAQVQLAPQTDAMSRGTETILLVEDETALRDITGEFLESLGYTVLTAPNSARALELCKNDNVAIHVLLTDVIMPGIGGLELAKIAEQCRPGLRTIYVSGYTDRAIDQQILGPNGVFLQKPYSLVDLSLRIREACTGG